LSEPATKLEPEPATALEPEPATALEPEPATDLERELMSYLEPTQLVSGTSRPVPRRSLSPRADAALWALRIVVMILGAMVIYTFVSQVV